MNFLAEICSECISTQSIQYILHNQLQILTNEDQEKPNLFQTIENSLK